MGHLNEADFLSHVNSMTICGPQVVSSYLLQQAGGLILLTLMPDSMSKQLELNFGVKLRRHAQCFEKRIVFGLNV